MISIIFPIANYAFFVNACCQNTFETAGIDKKDIDLVFISGNTLPEHLYQTLIKYQKIYNFRIVIAPFPVDEQLTLLDWFIRTDKKLNKWFVVQHCDAIWTTNCNWLKKIAPLMKDNFAVSFNFNEYKFFEIHEKQFFPMHDYIGFYNKEKLIENNLFFIWGTINGKCKLSNHVKNAIIDGKIKRSKWAINRSGNDPKSQEISFNKDFIDGSEAIALELSYRFPEQVTIIDGLEQNIKHLWGINKARANLITTNNGVHAKNLHCLNNLAFLTSFMCNQEDRKQGFFPWKIFADYGHAPNCIEWAKYTDNTENVGFGTPKWLKYVKIGSKLFLLKNNRFQQIIRH